MGEGQSKSKGDRISGLEILMWFKICGNKLEEITKKSRGSI